MSPEQSSGAKNCGKPSDVFSMGATLYALLAGRAPFEGGSIVQILKATCTQPHTPIRALRPDISAATAEVIDRCLAKSPDTRCADAAALLTALKACRAGLATLRIFIASPGDVAEEHDKARLVIEQLQRVYGSRVRLVPALWEELPLRSNASIQDGIDLVSSDEYGIDIAVFILWSRLAALTGGAMRKADGSLFQNGTELELCVMLEARKRGGGRPQLLIYVRNDKGGFEDLPRISRSRGSIGRDRAAPAYSGFQSRSHLRRLEQSSRPPNSYDTPLTFARRLKVDLRATIDEILGDGAIDGAHWEHDPYRGLQVFDLEHAPIFFGREREVCELQELLQRRSAAGCAFAVIVGASGSGKSSLARAGVAAALIRDNLDKTVTQWRLGVMQPGAMEGAPIAALVNALTKTEALPELLHGGTTKEDIVSGLERDAKLTINLSFKPAFDRAASQANGRVKLFLILDQTEELWTDRGLTHAIREQFLSAIEALARSGLVWVLATLRTDFFPLAQLSETFLRLKGNDGGYDLVAPGADALQRIILEPARLAGMKFERNESTGQSLDQVILRDAIGQPDALPLLEYALDQLFSKSGEGGAPARLLQFAAYEKMGGVIEGALGEESRSGIHKTAGVEVQAVFGSVMNALVTVDAGAEAQPLRRTAPLASVTDTGPRKNLIDVLVNNRLLTTDKEGGNAVVRVAHEALLRRWDRLVAWIAANREYLRLRSRVEQSQARWKQSEGDKSLLLPLGLPLEEGHKLLRGAPELLTRDTTEYIRQSEAHHKTAAIRSRKLRHVVTSALAAMLIFALAGGVFAWVQRGEAQSALKKQTRLAFEASVLNAQMFERNGDLEGIVKTLDPYLKLAELRDHEKYAAAEQLSQRALQFIQMNRDAHTKIAARETDVRIHVGRGAILELILIPAGTFIMGSPANEGGHPDEAQHPVTISNAFYMGKYTVTQAQYEAVTDHNPSCFYGLTNPVETVSWDDAIAFCDMLNAKLKGTLPAGMSIQLPTEACWEYACRAGTTTTFNTGDVLTPDQANYLWTDTYNGSPKKAALQKTTPVGSFKPNAFGLYDMHGNVWQWCQDAAWTGFDSNSKERVFARVLRGGCWSEGSVFCRSAFRFQSPPEHRSSYFGFRLVLALSTKTSP